MQSYNDLQSQLKTIDHKVTHYTNPCAEVTSFPNTYCRLTMCRAIRLRHRRMWGWQWMRRQPDSRHLRWKISWQEPRWRMNCFAILRQKWISLTLKRRVPGKAGWSQWHTADRKCCGGQHVKSVKKRLPPDLQSGFLQMEERSMQRTRKILFEYLTTVRWSSTFYYKILNSAKVKEG